MLSCDLELMHVTVQEGRGNGAPQSKISTTATDDWSSGFAGLSNTTKAHIHPSMEPFRSNRDLVLAQSMVKIILSWCTITGAIHQLAISRKAQQIQMLITVRGSSASFPLTPLLHSNKNGNFGHPPTDQYHDSHNSRVFVLEFAADVTVAVNGRNARIFPNCRVCSSSISK